MRHVWREENLAEGTLSPRMQTPRLGDVVSSKEDDGEKSRLAARLSSMQTQKMQASALASARAQQVAQLASAQQAAALQLDVLRTSHDGLSQAAASLEAKLRQEVQRSEKLKRQVHAASERAKHAGSGEADALADAASARAEVAEYKRALATRDLAVARAKEETEAMRAERDASELRAATRLAERDSAKATLADSKTTVTELNDQRQGVQRQLEAARMSLIDEREARRTKEAERLAAVASADSATKKLEMALKQLERERSQASDIVKRGLAAEQLLADLEARNNQLSQALEAERAESAVMAGDRAMGGKRLLELRNAVGELAASILIAGDGADPVRVHNEMVVSKLFEALAVSGGQLSKRQWAVEGVETNTSKVRGEEKARHADAPPASSSNGNGNDAHPNAPPRPPSSEQSGKAPRSRPASAGKAKAAKAPKRHASPTAADAAEVAVAAVAGLSTLGGGGSAEAGEAMAAAKAVTAAAETAKAAAAAADAAARGVPSTADKSKYIVQPLGIASPRQLAKLRQAQRDSGQLLMDMMARLEEATMAQRRRLQARLLELGAKLHYRGEASATRDEIVHELRSLASDESPALPVPPSLDVARPRELVLPQNVPGEWPPISRPSTTPAEIPQAPTLPWRPSTVPYGAGRPQSQRATQASSGSEAIDPSRSSSPSRSPLRQRPATAASEWHWQRSSSPDRR